MAGQIETYLHSDSQTPHKGAAVVQVTCESDFGARTVDFISFTKRVAVLAYAVSGDAPQLLKDVAYIRWDDIIKGYPEIAEEHTKLEAKIKEKVELKHAYILALCPHWEV
jgi:translation elongation factor EF-Ts